MHVCLGIEFLQIQIAFLIDKYLFVYISSSNRRGGIHSKEF